jgi:magnesium chelatase subunit I
VKEPALRVQIVSQRSVFDENPAEFRDKYDTNQKALTAKIVEARNLLKKVRVCVRVCVRACVRV